MNTATALRSLSATLTLAPAASAPLSTDEGTWFDLIALANAHMLGPALYERLLAGTNATLPEDVREYLAMLFELNERRNDALRRQASELVRALNGAGIRPVLLKGAITLLDPKDPLHRARMMRDIDFLVPLNARAPTIAVLDDLGYWIHERYEEGHHAYGEFARDDTPGTVDLHTELVDPAYILSAAEIHGGIAPIDVDGLYATAPSPTHRLLHHVLHAQVHYLGNYYHADLKLNQLLEFAVLAERFRQRVDWAFIERRMAAHRLTDALHSYLLAAQTLFGLSWPLQGVPTDRARRHLRRCLWRLRRADPSRLQAVVGNVFSAFAWHRMNALYGAGSVTGHRLRHALLFLGKSSPHEMCSRLLR